MSSVPAALHRSPSNYSYHTNLRPSGARWEEAWGGRALGPDVLNSQAHGRENLTLLSSSPAASRSRFIPGGPLGVNTQALAMIDIASWSDLTSSLPRAMVAQGKAPHRTAVAGWDPSGAPQPSFQKNRRLDAGPASEWDAPPSLRYCCTGESTERKMRRRA